MVSGISYDSDSSLSRSATVHFTDPDEAADFLSSSAVPYRSELLSPRAAFSTRIAGVDTEKARLSRVSTVGQMRVHARLPEEFYAVVLSVSGHLNHKVENAAVEVDPYCALCHSPMQVVTVDTPQQFELVFLKLKRDDLLAELENRLLRPVHSPLKFAPGFDLTTEAGRTFRTLVFDLWTELQAQAGARPRLIDGLAQPSGNSLLVSSILDHLVTLLLEAQRHNYSRLLTQHQDAGPWHVRAAEEFISAKAGTPLSLGDVCVAAGVNSRTLQHSFQRTRGCSPMQFLRAVRLDRAHADLRKPQPGCTVTEVASRWGFFHFGRFAAQYQKRFGERPSETLQRSKA